MKTMEISSVSQKKRKEKKKIKALLLSEAGGQNKGGGRSVRENAKESIEVNPELIFKQQKSGQKRKIDRSISEESGHQLSNSTTRIARTDVNPESTSKRWKKQHKSTKSSEGTSKSEEKGRNQNKSEENISKLTEMVSGLTSKQQKKREKKARLSEGTPDSKGGQQKSESGKGNEKAVDTEPSKKKKNRRKSAKSCEGISIAKGKDHRNRSKPKSGQNQETVKQPLVQGEYTEYPEYPGWSKDEIHWLLQVCGNYKNRDMNWNKYASVLKKHSVSDCKDLMTKIEASLKPLTVRSAINYVKKLISVSLCNYKELQVEGIPKQPEDLGTIVAKKENLTKKSVSIKKLSLNNLKIAEYMAMSHQSCLDFHLKCFHFFKQHPSVLEKLHNVKFGLRKRMKSRTLLGRI